MLWAAVAPQPSPGCARAWKYLALTSLNSARLLIFELSKVSRNFWKESSAFSLIAPKYYAGLKWFKSVSSSRSPSLMNSLTELVSSFS